MENRMLRKAFLVQSKQKSSTCDPAEGRCQPHSDLSAFEFGMTPAVDSVCLSARVGKTGVWLRER